MSTGVTSADVGSPQLSRGRSLAGLLRFIPGLRGRLLLAFVAISLFVVVAAAAGLYAVGDVEQSLARTLTTVPVALDARELWRKSEKIIGVGPMLVNATSATEAEALSSRLRDELADTSTILARLRNTNLDLDPLDEIEDVMIQLNKNLDLMLLAWSDGIAAAERNRRAVSEALTAYRQFGNIWQPRFSDLNAKIVRLQGVKTSADAGPEQRQAAADQFGKAAAALLALEQIQIRAGSAFELINRAANLSDTAEIDSDEALARETVRAMEGPDSNVDPNTWVELSGSISQLRSALVGNVSIFSWTRRGFEAKAGIRRLIAENEALSVRLKAAVDQLVAASRREIASAESDAARVQVLGRTILLAVAALSLASSLLIVWLYVGRNIVARLTNLSGGLTAIAGGRRDVIVDTKGSDEVSAMGRAVEVLRQHEIERDTLLVERAETAQRLEQLVNERTKELNETVGTLKEASEVIASSIQYASRIQRSILPESNLVDSTLSDYFILWEPRDVVSGDVYWLARWGDGLLIAVGDCTGHGVPGAFVTLIANSALERALLDVVPGAVGQLISRMNQLIKSTLKQAERGGESDDGMDLGICYIPSNHARVSFAGAGISLLSAPPGKDLVEIKGGKRGIGYRRIPLGQTYSETELPVVPGTRFYMTSDGLIDQIGGERHRSFGLTRLMTLLDRHQELSMAQQKSLLVTTLCEYQGQETRRDDVLVLGFRL
jgi:serine phosphatase RsbU (regulator of sigma subunit)